MHFGVIATVLLAVAGLSLGTGMMYILLLSVDATLLLS